MRATAVATLLANLLATACGYHVAGRADRLPSSLRTIAVPAFANLTTRHRLAESLPAAITQEFLSRTRYRIVADPGQADAVLNGVVVSYNSYPTVFDPATGRATGVAVSVTLQITLTERATGRVLFSRPHFEARERYEISVDQRSYLDESDAALERLSRQVARTIVSAVLENF